MSGVNIGVKMTILFLDFDGVTHPWPVDKSKMFDKQCLENLHKSFGKASIQIVVSSTWREHLGLQGIKQKLGRLGDYVSGVTPIIDEPFLHHVRYHEVKLFLKENNLIGEKWVAVDDEQGNYPKERQNVLITNHKTGFTQCDIVKLKDMLAY